MLHQYRMIRRNSNGPSMRSASSFQCNDIARGWWLEAAAFAAETTVSDAKGRRTTRPFAASVEDRSN